jgi:co-chaperonin GroES (HSP10)
METMKPAFSPHKLSKKQIKALHDHVIVSEMIFDQRITHSGIILMNDNGTTLGIRPRWGRVYAVGPKQRDVTIGQWVCIDHGRWTRGLDIEDESGKTTIRRIDPKDILLISNSDEMPQDDTMSTAVHVAKQTRD